MLSIWTFLKHNNLIPYVAIVGMGFVIYLLWHSNIQKDLALAQEEANREALQQAFAVQAMYANEAIEKIQSIQNQKWKEGYHVEVLNYIVNGD